LAEGLSIEVAISRFAAEATKKLAAIGARGEPEDQIRSPLEGLLADLADLCGIGRSNLVAVGESSIADLKTRPDYAIQTHGALVGFVEVKAPGKGADPRKFKDKHDKDQWSKLRALPNLVYTDGNEFSLWRSGELIGKLVKLDGDIAVGGAAIKTASGIEALFEDFFRWEPIAPKTPKQLADLTARVCRLMRDEVTEQLALRNPALTDLAGEWRTLLFPDADERTFADGYAQAVTFGLLVARARGISVSAGVASAAQQIGSTHSLIGSALFILTLNTEGNATLKTSIGTLTRVLEVVDWPKISKGKPEAWLYFYEEFLSVYDGELRKKTGSYYTPPEVVTAMVGFVETALRTRFDRPNGLAAPDVTLVDPAVGTGTFLLAALRSIAETVEADQGAGAVPGMIEDALQRLIGFEIQLGPFAVAQLRLLAELADLGVPTGHELRMYVTDTLANPYVEEEKLGLLYEPIAESRRKANEIKKDQQVLVVIGNPPYKEKAKGRGGWVESGSREAKVAAPLAAWFPPKEWGVGAHAKHLRNLYVYFWRWATWKVFDHHPDHDTGVVCFITVAGFLNGPGFQKMRDYLRRTADEIWVIDCSPEGHQPEVSTRIFQGVQQPVCIVMASRSKLTQRDAPAAIRFRSLPVGHRIGKFEALAAIDLTDGAWADCPTGWREPFLPAAQGAWPTYPALSDLFIYDGSGVMPGRTWIIAPDQQTLVDRWSALINAGSAEKAELFQPHLRKGKPGDKHVNKVVASGLAGHAQGTTSVAADAGAVVTPVRYGFRSFDRQWIIPDSRVINQPNPGLWAAMSPAQLYLTALSRTAPRSGPAATTTASVPDLDHYNGRGGRVFPLWLDHAATVSNVRPGVLAQLSSLYGFDVSGEDFFAYVVGVVAHPAFATRFSVDLATPGIRVPLTADSPSFERAAELGRRAIWLHSFGERCSNSASQRPPGRPRLPADRAPKVPADGVISTRSGEMTDSMEYDAAARRLRLGRGYVENVSPAMWAYEVSGMSVLVQWFSYRRANRERPLIGDKRPPSKLERIQPDRWQPEYTTELLDILHVLGLLVDLEPSQAAALDAVCQGPLIGNAELEAAGAFVLPVGYPTAPFRASASQPASASLFDLESQ
jgi:hypothetical protein